MLDHVSLDLRNLDISPVLRGHEDLLDGNRLVVDIAHGHLSLPIGIEIIQRAVLADLREALSQTMCKVDGHGHERGRLVARIAEHDALVACADAVVGIIASNLALLDLVGLVDAHGDICRLGMHVVGDGAGLSIEAHFRPNVTDVTHGGRERLDGATHFVDIGGTAARRHIALSCELGLFRQNRVEDSVGHLVAQLVGMSFGHRLGCEQIRTCFSHVCSLQVHAPPRRRGCRLFSTNIISAFSQ